MTEQNPLITAEAIDRLEKLYDRQRIDKWSDELRAGAKVHIAEFNKKAAIEEPRKIDETISNTKQSPHKLKPLKRGTTDSLVLLYEIFDHYNVGFIDELSPQAAWHKIMTGEFKSELICRIAPNKKHIIMVDDKKLTRAEFKRKYKGRFEKLDKTPMEPA
jgi:hypothetical protein